MSQTKFRFLTGDVNWREYGGTFVSQKFNNGPGKSRYNVSLSAVAPSEVNPKDRERAFEYCDIKDTSDLHVMQIVEAIYTYGIRAPIWDKNGNNIRELFKEARREADVSSMLFGFVMDRTVNAIGSNGWDFIKGDITAGLDRWREEQNREV
jgi:hypothetical protein